MSRTLIVAHRGANREAMENTRAAFEKALDYPIDGIETDIQLSRDEIPVLWHDDDLDKLGLPAKHIDDFDHAQLREMGVMSLRDFTIAYHARCNLLLEIKKYPGEPTPRQQSKIRKTLEFVGASTDDRILVSSFDLESLIHAHGIAPQQNLVLNLEPEQGVGFTKRALSEHPFLHGVCVYISTLDEAMVDVVRERDKFLAVYTCNSDEEIRRALTFAVDVLISDVPQKALMMRDELRNG